jgi:transcription elongation factor GreA
MATATILITGEGRDELELRLEDLRAARLLEYSKRLRDARAHGEAAVNDEYLAILEDEAVIDSQIARLEELLARARVVDGHEAAAGEVAIGATVAVEDEVKGTVERFRIAGSLAPTNAGTVTAGSPIGEALIGRRAGDRVTVELPDGRVRDLRVLAIEAEGHGVGG